MRHPPRLRLGPRAFAILGSTFVLACGGDGDQPAPPPVESAEDSVAIALAAAREELGGLDLADLRVTIPWQQGLVVNEPAGTPEPSTVSRITADSVGNYDRVTIEFDTRDTGMGYHTELPEAPPQRCNSSIPPESVAEHWIVLRISPATAELAEPVQRVGLDNVRGFELICASGGQVAIAIPLNRAGAYRLIDVKNPERIIIDVIH